MAFRFILALLSVCAPAFGDPSGRRDGQLQGVYCQMGADKYFIVSKSAVGVQLPPLPMEEAANAELLRFRFREGAPEMRKVSKLEFKRNDKIFLGDRPGRVLAVSEGKMEISLRISGKDANNAVVDCNGDVVGVVAGAPFDVNPLKWDAKRARDFAPKSVVPLLRDVVWEKTDVELYRRKLAAKEQEARIRAKVVPETEATFKNPSLKINRKVKEGSGGEEFFVNGNIVLALSRNRGVKNPVVRLAVLVEGGGKIFMFDAISQSPGGNFQYSSVPVRCYGMGETGKNYNTTAGVAANCLEGISFFQSQAKFDVLPGGGRHIEYFDRSSLLTGGFRLPDAVKSGRTPPKIVAYRFECWQNSSLAGVYDSARHGVLKSRDIPQDWYVPGKYPGAFVYLRDLKYCR